MVDWKLVLGAVSSFFSVLFLFISPVWSWILAGSVFTTAILFIGLVISYIFNEKDWSGQLRWFVVPLFLLSLIAAVLAHFTTKKGKEKEELADATEILMDETILNSEVSEWVPQAVRSGSFVAFLYPSRYSNDSIMNLIEDQGYLQERIKALINREKKEEGQAKFEYTPEIGLINTSYQEQTVHSKYEIGFANAPCLKRYWLKEDFTLLPESAIATLKGVESILDWHYEEAKRYLQLADSLGNPAGTYYLSRWFVVGYNQDPDSLNYRIKLEEAANNGSRTARYEWSKLILNNPRSSEIDKAKAEAFLRQASEPGTISSTAILSRKAMLVLNDYYHETNQHIKAYLGTRRQIKTFRQSPIKYREHLMNCLEVPLPRVREAKRIVLEGEKLPRPEANCFYVHGLMFMKGIGVKKDYTIAERYFRYAADTLHYSKAYLGLASLCQETGKPGYEYWKMLYDVNFTETIAQ